MNTDDKKIYPKIVTAADSDVMGQLWNSTTTVLSLLETETATLSAEEIESSTTSYQHISFVIAWLTLALCVFGLVGNIFSIIIYSSPSMISPINVLLMGTSYIDFTLSLLSIPTFVIPGMYAYYKTSGLLTLQAYATAYVYPLTLMMQSASVYAFVVITVERYQAVCRPFRGKLSTVQRSRLALVIICVLAVAYNAVRFFEFRIYYTGEDGNDTNETQLTRSADVEPALRNVKTYMNVYYVGLFLVTHFAVPFLILVILNSLIIRTICQSRQRRRALNKKERSEHRTAIMMVIVVLTFIFCYTLLFTLNILEAATDWFYDARHMALLFALNDISNVLVVTNAASSIIVYYFFSQKYRQLLVDMLGRIFPRSCIRYMEISIGQEHEHSLREDETSKMPGQNSDRAATPLLTPHSSFLKANGFKCQPSTLTGTSHLLHSRVSQQVGMHLFMKETNHSPNCLVIIANDADGICSDQES